MPESAFLNAIAAYLAGPAGLSPAPVSVGGAEPVAEAEAPALVLSLDQVNRLDGGIGGGFEAMSGTLAVTSTIDLASPFLVGEPTFSLLSPDRLVLTLPKARAALDGERLRRRLESLAQLLGRQAEIRT